MVNCAFCRCSLRTTVMIIALISLVHFMVESTVTYYIEGDHRLMISSASTLYYTIATCQGLMIVLSILLFVGAYMSIIWLCLPWLILAVLNVLYHFYVLILLTMQTISNFDATKLEMLTLIAFSGACLAYMAYLVYCFVMYVRKGDTFPGAKDEEDSYPLMK